MPDTSEARTAIREARNAHRDVMGGMSMADLKLTAAAGLLRDEDPLPFDVDDPVWIEDAFSGLGDALAACDRLHDLISAARTKVWALRDAQRRTGIPEHARCRAPMVHADKSESPCILAGSHIRDDTEHEDEHGHHAPLLVTWATLQEVRHVQAMRDAGEIA